MLADEFDREALDSRRRWCRRNRIENEGFEMGRRIAVHDVVVAVRVVRSTPRGRGVREGRIAIGVWFLGHGTVSYTHLRAHETVLDLVCRLLLEKKKD